MSSDTSQVSSLRLESCSVEEVCGTLGGSEGSLADIRDRLKDWLEQQPHLPQGMLYTCIDTCCGFARIVRFAKDFFFAKKLTHTHVVLIFIKSSGERIRGSKHMVSFARDIDNSYTKWSSEDLHVVKEDLFYIAFVDFRQEVFS